MKTVRGDLCMEKVCSRRMGLTSVLRVPNKNCSVIVRESSEISNAWINAVSAGRRWTLPGFYAMMLDFSEEKDKRFIQSAVTVNTVVVKKSDFGVPYGIFFTVKLTRPTT